MKLKITFPSCLKKKQKSQGDGITPKGIHHSVVPSDYLEKYKYNDLEKINSKKTIII